MNDLLTQYLEISVPFKYLELLEVQKGKGRRRQSGGRWSSGRQ